MLGLLAEGRTNRQIGEILFISGKSASVHVTNLLRKLGVESRTEAAEMSRRLRWAAQRPPLTRGWSHECLRPEPVGLLGCRHGR